MSVIGLDIGTTGVKACAFDDQGGLLARAYQEYPLIFPKPGWIEIDPKQVLGSTRKVLAQAVSEAKSKGDPVRAIATSAQGEAVTPVDADGQPLGNSIVTFDPRTERYVSFWEERLGRQKFFEMTGMPLHGMYTLPKVQWWKDERPEVFNKARHFLCYEDLAAKAVFGLAPVLGTSLAGRTGAYDLKQRCWSKEIFAIADIDSNLFGEPKSAGAIVGEIPDAAADALGLETGTLLVVGGHDQALCALGCGIVKPGVSSYVTGTVECMTPLFEGVRLDAQMQKHNFCCYESALPGTHQSIVFNFTGGSLLKWCRDGLWPELAKTAEKQQRDPYDELLKGLPESPTNLFVLPHFTTTGTPHLDTRSRGAIIGLKLETKREEIVKAVLESVTYEMALNAKLQRESDIQISEYRAIGGGAKSEAWMRIKADILGVPVACMENDEAGCLGGAILGLAALKKFNAIAEASTALTKVRTVYEPDARRHNLYSERLEVYGGLYPALKETVHKISEWDQHSKA